MFHQSCQIFSMLDAKDGFLQVRLNDQSTTFWGPKGKYRWLRLPFGLSSAPEEFQRRLQAVLYEIDSVVVVADDILIYGKGDSQEEARDNHDEALLQVLRQARKCNLKFNKDKLRLHLPELQYIGHRISSEGVRPDPAKVVAIKDMQSQPRSHKLGHSWECVIIWQSLSEICRRRPNHLGD